MNNKVNCKSGLSPPCHAFKDMVNIMDKKNWSWNLLHPEQMTPGSFWKLRDKTSFCYLEDPDSIDVHIYGYSQWLIDNLSLSFELEKIYFLVDIKENNGAFDVSFLSDDNIVSTRVAKSSWDSVFSLVAGSTNPVHVQRMFLGRIPEEKLLKKLKKNNSL